MSYYNIDTGSRHFLSSGFQASSICLLIHIASLDNGLEYSGCNYCRRWSSYQAQPSCHEKQGCSIQLPGSTSLHILAMGRCGHKTTLWSVQNDFFDKIMVISCLETNLTRWYKRILEQNTASKVLWIGFRTLCEYINWDRWSDNCVVVEHIWELRLPLSQYLKCPPVMFST